MPTPLGYYAFLPPFLRKQESRIHAIRDYRPLLSQGWYVLGWYYLLLPTHTENTQIARTCADDARVVLGYSGHDEMDP